MDERRECFLTVCRQYQQIMLDSGDHQFIEIHSDICPKYGCSRAVKCVFRIQGAFILYVVIARRLVTR